MVNTDLKKTPIGNLPVEWNYCTAKELMKIETGSRNTEHKSDNGRYPFFVRSQQVEHIDTYNYDCEAVLTAGDGVGTGKVFHYINGKFDAHQRVYVMSQFSQIDAKYFYYFFSYNFGAEVSKYTAKSSVDSVRRNMIADMLIPLPDIEEQKKIAEALSDIDKLISTLEKQIAKKKAIKQGVMQELITGKKRLKGFDKEWSVYNLEDLCHLITKQTGFDYTNEIKSSLIKVNIPGTIPFIQNKDFEGNKVNLKTDYFIPTNTAKKYPKIMLNETCMLISLSGRIGNVGVYNRKYGHSFIGGAVGICKFYNPDYAEWAMLYLSTEEGQKQIFEKQKTGAQHNLTVADVRKLSIKLPQTMEEIKGIVYILSDIEQDIIRLEEKHEKYTAIKQGMMEQLLTGKIRLV